MGLDNFTRLFGNAMMRKNLAQVMMNTIGMGLLGILFSPLPIIFAVFLNEMTSTKFKKIVQSLTTLPNFVSWVVMFSIVFSACSTSGWVNSLFVKAGIISQPINFLASKNHVWLTMQMYGIWKGKRKMNSTYRPVFLRGGTGLLFEDTAKIKRVFISYHSADFLNGVAGASKELFGPGNT